MTTLLPRMAGAGADGWEANIAWGVRISLTDFAVWSTGVLNAQVIAGLYGGHSSGPI